MINNSTEFSYFIPFVSSPIDEKPKPFIEINKDKAAIYKEPKLTFTTKLYVASLTVVGLFIIFRFVQKSK
jgi:hypothetical protein